MKNILKFLLLVLVLSAGVSLLYDYQLSHGRLNLSGRRAPEKYTFARETAVDPKSIASLVSLSEERRKLVAGVIPSVVSVKTTKRIPRRQHGLDPFDFFRGNYRPYRGPEDEAMVQNSLGSGVIVTNEGHIITNNHVVDQVDEIEVQLSDGQVRKARLIGADQQLDLAVLKMEGNGARPLKLGDSDQMQAGDFVLAVGNPFGFEETVTDGIISSKGRPNRIDGFGDYLQTNAAINPGNSGGPLLNLRGEVIGINTAIISRSGGSQGIGFAIPSNTVKMALESLLKEGRIIRGYLGIETPAPRPGPFGGSNTDSGVLVSAVMPHSPAADAKIQPGDVITKFNGHEIRNIAELQRLVSQVDLNKKVEVEMRRQGKPVTVAAEIKEQPANYQLARALPPGDPRLPPSPNGPGADEEEAVPSRNGALAAIEVQELTPKMAQTLGVPRNIRGVVVTRVEGGNGTGDLRAGDVIEAVNQEPVASVQEYEAIVQQLDPSQPQILSVCRQRSRSFVVVKPR